MNFALPTAAIILALVPGIVFQISYFSGRFPKQFSPISPLTELVHYFLFAIPIDILAFYVIQKNHPILRELGREIFSSNSDGNSFTILFAKIIDNWHQISFHYLYLLAIIFVVGIFLRRMVWTFRLDIRIHSLRMKHQWFYLLLGRLPECPRMLLPYADVLVSHPSEGTRLFRGLVTAFDVNQFGEIKELILRNVRRGKGRGLDFKWAAVPSHRFVLLGSTINSINMRYISIEPPVGTFNRYRWHMKIFVRSFLFEEP